MLRVVVFVQLVLQLVQWRFHCMEHDHRFEHGRMQIWPWRHQLWNLNSFGWSTSVKFGLKFASLIIQNLIASFKAALDRFGITRSLDQI